MKMKLVRKYLLEKRVGVPEIRTSDTVLIFDGGYFKGTYKLSGCQFILGGEYDRYANYLKNSLNQFIKLGIECFVVINGAMQVDSKTRREIHQNIIDRTNAIQPGRTENEYCEPIFVKDVQREVFEELNVKYFVCEYDHREALINLARKHDCPIITNNFEYCLFGVSCILPSSIVFDVDNNGFKCTVFHPNTKLFPLRVDLMSILLAISDEDAIYYKHMPAIFNCHINNVFKGAQYWIRRQTKNSAVDYLTKYLNAQDSLLSAISDIRRIFNNDHYFVLKRFNNHANIVKEPIELRKGNWFRDGVTTGQIAIPYINLKYNKIFSGTWHISDMDKNDAMLVSLDIVFYVLGILSNSQQVSLSFIGRQFDNSHIWNRDFKLKSNCVLKYFYSNKKQFGSDVLKIAICEILPGFDFLALKGVAEECHMLMVALVYYCAKTKEFETGVYSILLSYLMLGPISDEVGLLKRSNFVVTHSTSEDHNDKKREYISVARAFMDLFYVDESHLKHVFYRDILHRFAEFEHCLQHVNYLNKLCGERSKSTCYHKTINSPFIYNVFITLRDKKYPLDYLKQRMNCDSIYLEYTKLIDVFEKCFEKVEKSTM